jgi:tetratricopeptide (TPR) repeat protein
MTGRGRRRVGLATRARALGWATAAGALVLGLASAAGAEPSIWAKARAPELAERSRLIAEAEDLMRLHDDPASSPDGRDPSFVLQQARRLFEQAGAASSPDPRLRLRYAGVLEEQGDFPAAATALEAVVHAKPTPAAPFLAEAYRRLGICYAKTGATDDEIKAYDHALAVEPDTGYRSLLEANRAEAWMTLGHVEAAVAGYREALADIGNAAGMRVTTLWSLGVALDREGDLDGGLESIHLARDYDPRDTSIHDRNTWFYSVDYEEAWYEALGHWSAARYAEVGAVRAEEYGRAIGEWEDYIARAPAKSPYAELAKAHLRKCEKERAEARKRPGLKVTVRAAGPIGASMGGGPLPRVLPPRPGAVLPRPALPPAPGPGKARTP